MYFVVEDTYVKVEKTYFVTLHYITTPLTPEVTSGASTKSYSSFIVELEQVSFQLFFKGISVC